MTKQTTKWKDRGFSDKYEYSGWLYFNDLTDDCKMYDDVYYDDYSGRIVNINVLSDEEVEEDEAEKFLSVFESEKRVD